MCINRFFNHGACGHPPVRRLFRCGKPSVCKIVCKVERYDHAAECPACLDGNLWPSDSYTLRHAEIIPNEQQTLEYGQTLLDILVCFLVSQYEDAKQDDLPLISNPNTLFRVATVIIQADHSENGCVECGKRTFRDYVGPVCSCRGMNTLVETDNPSRQLHIRFASDANHEKFMELLDPGEEARIMRSVESGWGPVPMAEAEAAIIVHQPFRLSGATVKARMDLCADKIAQLVDELANTPRASFTDQKELDEYSRSSRVMLSNVARYMMAGDTGLPSEHMVETLKLLAPCLLHPQDNRRPASWQRYFALGYDAYQDVMMGYLRRFRSASDVLEVITGERGFKAVLHKISVTHSEEMDRLMQTMDQLLDARLKVYGTSLGGASKASKPADPKYYDVLGLTPAATGGEVKKAYYRLAKVHHPDKIAPGQAVDAAKFREINDAYEHISSHVPSDTPGTEQTFRCCVCNGGKGREGIKLNRCGHDFCKACLIQRLLDPKGMINCCPVCSASWDWLQPNSPQIMGEGAAWAGYEGRSE